MSDPSSPSGGEVKEVKEKKVATKRKRGGATAKKDTVAPAVGTRRSSRIKAGKPTKKEKPPVNDTTPAVEGDTTTTTTTTTTTESEEVKPTKAKKAKKAATTKDTKPKEPKKKGAKKGKGKGKKGKKSSKEEDKPESETTTVAST